MPSTDASPSLLGRFADFLGTLTDRVKIRAQEAGDEWRRAHSLYAFRHASITCVRLFPFKARGGSPSLPPSLPPPPSP